MNELSREEARSLLDRADEIGLRVYDGRQSPRDRDLAVDDQGRPLAAERDMTAEHHATVIDHTLGIAVKLGKIAKADVPWLRERALRSDSHREGVFDELARIPIRAIAYAQDSGVTLDTLGRAHCEATGVPIRTAPARAFEVANVSGGAFEALYEIYAAQTGVRR